ncbi:MAG: hypothetical protein C5B49_12350 [Bdellovibrio sp.]|nr:MAG: hypothetical protein C5B49_12350 [Bdellovibrio sp.]
MRLRSLVVQGLALILTFFQNCGGNSLYVDDSQQRSGVHTLNDFSLSPSDRESPLPESVPSSPPQTESGPSAPSQAGSVPSAAGATLPPAATTTIQINTSGHTWTDSSGNSLPPIVSTPNTILNVPVQLLCSTADVIKSGSVANSQSINIAIVKQDHTVACSFDSPWLKDEILSEKIIPLSLVDEACPSLPPGSYNLVIMDPQENSDLIESPLPAPAPSPGIANSISVTKVGLGSWKTNVPSVTLLADLNPNRLLMRQLQIPATSPYGSPQNPSIPASIPRNSNGDLVMTIPPSLCNQYSN